MKTITVKPEIRKISYKYTTETAIFIGKLKIASYFYDGLRAKTDLHNYRMKGYLNFIRQDLGKFVTTEEAEKELIKVVNYVIDKLQIQFITDKTDQ